MSSSEVTPQLIAIDWGTTNARAYLLGSEGGAPVVLAQTVGEGILSVEMDVADRDAEFAAILERMVGAWLDENPGLPMIACGMVGAAQGWRPAEYRTLPTQLASAGGLVSVGSPRGALPIIAGVKKSEPNADVMRGEETQLAGVAADLPAGITATIALPGTHTKWATVRDGVMLDFDTAMSGELFGLIADHSMVGRAAAPAGPDHDWRPGFDWGLRLAETERPLAFAAFVIRSSVLDGQLPAEQVPDAISGLLIGQEVLARADALQDEDGEVLLVGAGHLIERYVHALDWVGVRSRPAVADATVRGLWQSALGAGLIDGGK